MKLFIKGSGEVTLTQRNYVATGGQASVYVKDGVAYKIYTDPKDTIPEAKFQALSSIKDPAVIKPDKLLLNEKKVPTGYTMVAVSDNLSLCQLFTRTFRERNNVTNDHIIDIAAKLRTHVANVHAAGIIIVDLNELNLLVPKTFDDVGLIDVDSYQTQGYPATVIMPSVRDYSARSADFSPLSDWYSYGVLAFQLFIGMHPYKGSHPAAAAIPKDQQMVFRMKQHLSAFHPEARLPKCCYPMDVIPPHFRQWMHAVLQDGKRLPPPDPKSIAALIVQQVIAQPLISGGNITLNEILDLEGWSLVSYAESGGSTIALTSKGGFLRTIVNGRAVSEVSAPTISAASTIVGFTPKMNHPVSLNVSRGQVTFNNHDRRTSQVTTFTAQEIARAGNRFYVRNGTRVLEVEFAEMPSNTVVTASHTVANVMEMASRLYEGVAIQSMIGSVFVSVFPKSKFGAQVRIPELDSYKVIDAKFEGGVLMVVGAKTGKYDRLVFRFDEDYQTYDLRKVEDISASYGINFVTLESGVCVCLNEEEKIEAFSAKKDAKGIKLIEDSALGSDIRLMIVGGKVGFERAGKIYQMTMK